MTILISVTEEKPMFTFAESLMTLKKDQAVAVPNKVVSTGGVNVVFTFVPPLPTALSFNLETSAIEGTPRALLPPTRFTVTGTNSGGSGTFVLLIEVRDTAPTSLSYSDPTITYTRGTVCIPPSAVCRPLPTICCLLFVAFCLLLGYY